MKTVRRFKVLVLSHEHRSDFGGCEDIGGKINAILTAAKVREIRSSSVPFTIWALTFRFKLDLVPSAMKKVLRLAKETCANHANRNADSAVRRNELRLLKTATCDFLVRSPVATDAPIEQFERQTTVDLCTC